jgi:hypothetical protein
LPQAHQSGANRGARHAQALDQGHLGNAAARRQFTSQDAFAQALLGFDGLAADFFGHLRHRLWICECAHEKKNKNGI